MANLIRDYPTETGQFQFLLTQPAETIKATVAAQIPNAADILNTPYAEGWFDHWRANVQKRLRRAAADDGASSNIVEMAREREAG